MAANTDAATDAATAAGQAAGGTHTTGTSFRDDRVLEDVGLGEAWGVNTKRTYDMHQTYDHESMIRARADWEDNRTSRARQAEDLHNLKMQTLQNAVETANMVGKQAVRHSDLAIDRQWNVDEVAQLIAKNPIFMDAVAASVVKRVQETGK